MEAALEFFFDELFRLKNEIWWFFYDFHVDRFCNVSGRAICLNVASTSREKKSALIKEI